MVPGPGNKALQHGTHNRAGRVGWWCADNPTGENLGGAVGRVETQLYIVEVGVAIVRMSPRKGRQQ